MKTLRRLILLLEAAMLAVILSACEFSSHPSITPSPTTPTPTFTTVVPTSPPPTSEARTSTAKFQVFILSPVFTCIAGNDFYSGDVCRGTNCGDCSCTRDDFDPPAPLQGISPEHINDPEYAGYKYRDCFEVTLSDDNISEITEDMQAISQMAEQWTGGALKLDMEIQVISYTHTGFVAPDFVFGPFEVDDELLNPYVDTDTDFVYVVTGQKDPAENKKLSSWCGGSYGEMSVHGAGYSYIQFNDLCNYVQLDNEFIYEPLVHEWIHSLDWALYNLNGVPDVYQFSSPDWANWKRGSWPACNKGNANPRLWFPSVDLCEWDPDWRDCNNVRSAGSCVHAGETYGRPSWYEHVLSVHYPRDIQFNGNICQDGRQDFGETGPDQGGPCP